MSELAADAPRPRLCHLRRWADFNGYGFNLHAEKGKVGHFVGKLDPESPAVCAGLVEGDRIVEVNGTNINNENHQQVVTRIKAFENEVKMLVADANTENFYKERGVLVAGDMDNLSLWECPTERPSMGGESPLIAPKTNGTVPTPCPRLCHMYTQENFAGYGFNLHAEKKRPGQFVGAIDAGSPAEASGLVEGDRIVQVNGFNIADMNHQQVVSSRGSDLDRWKVVGHIKTEPDHVRLLVMDAACDAHYQDLGVTVTEETPGVHVSGERVAAEPEPEPALEQAPPPAAAVVAADVEHPVSVRRCHIRKWAHFQGYGFHLHAEKGKAGHFIGGVETGSPAEVAQLRAGDRIVEVNDDSVMQKSHQETVERVKAQPGEVVLLVLDPEAAAYFESVDVPPHHAMSCVTHHATPDSPVEVEPDVVVEEASAEVEAVTLEATPPPPEEFDEEVRHPRLCHVRKWPHFQGYGFNLHAEKGKVGHFVGGIDEDSPAHAGGLNDGDIIVEVNGANVAGDSHQELVSKIKAHPDEVKLLVVSPDDKDWFQARSVIVHGGLDTVVTMTCPENPVVENGIATPVIEYEPPSDVPASPEVDLPPPLPLSPPPAYDDLPAYPTEGACAEGTAEDMEQTEEDNEYIYATVNKGRSLSGEAAGAMAEVEETLPTEEALPAEETLPEPLPSKEETVTPDEAMAAVAAVDAATDAHSGKPEPPEAYREPSPPPREPTPPPREPSPPPREPTPPPREATPPPREPTPPPREPTPPPPAEPAPSPEPAKPGPFAMSAAEARAQMTKKKSKDPRQKSMSMQEKYNLFQNL